MKQYQYDRVSAIYGTAEYETSRAPREGYAVRDRHDKNRHLGYVAKDGRIWRAVRPTCFGSVVGYHNARHSLTGEFRTRHDAAEFLRRLAASYDARDAS